MSLVCFLSNEVPEQPVISTVSGHVFEKRLILKYINEFGTDPASSQPLSPEQLVDVKANPLVKPRPPSATSIPALLKAMQDEWDAVMLHSFTLRQQLQTARQELSHSLYQHDAACRVIARLNKEVLAAREALATLKPHGGVAAQHHHHQVASETNGVASVEQNGGGVAKTEEGISEELSQKLHEKSASLTQLRKQKSKKVPEDLATLDEIKSFKSTASHTGLHSASIIGITCIDVRPNDSTRVVTGGNDKTAVVFNSATEQITATLKGHTKKITRVIFHPDEDNVITASSDATIRIWSVPVSQQVQFLKIHDAAVTGISLHPLGDYLLSCSADEHWAFSDIRTGKLLIKVSSAAMPATGDGSASSGTPSPLTCAQFHPDGLIFGTGTADSVIKIWDLKSKTNLANFPGHTGSITSMSFSENGYYLATSAEDSTVKLWDLRKLKNFKTLEFDDKSEIKDVSFDYSGSYLACGGTDIRIFQVKTWEVLKTINEHSSLVTGVRFGYNAKTLVSSSLDRSLKFYSV